MAILSKKDFMEKLKTFVGDRDDDEALAFIEDCKDTISSDGDEWKTKYEDEVQKNKDLEKSWREKYKARFFETDDDTPDKQRSENNKKTNPARIKDDEVDEEEQKLEQANTIKCSDLFTPAT